MEKEWFEYSQDDLKDTKKCMEVFIHMLKVLENDGHCREVYYKLFLALIIK